MLMCDSCVKCNNFPGTEIGMAKIKERRMKELTLSCYPDLHVGDCVPFYFCPRSIMLYMIYRGNNSALTYRGGQEPIIHLEFKLMDVVEWAKDNRKKWVFTDSNAGSRYFSDYCDLLALDKLDWDAINSLNWSNCKDTKQAEFLIEESIPWFLVNQIGVYSNDCRKAVEEMMGQYSMHKPMVTVERSWYY